MTDESWPITLLLIGWQAKLIAAEMPDAGRKQLELLLRLIEDGIVRSMRMEGESARQGKRLDELKALFQSRSLNLQGVIAAEKERLQIIQAIDENKAALEQLMFPIKAEWNRLAELTGQPDLKMSLNPTESAHSQRELDTKNGFNFGRSVGLKRRGEGFPQPTIGYLDSILQLTCPDASEGYKVGGSGYLMTDRL